jgi:hypothetical protein
MGEEGPSPDQWAASRPTTARPRRTGGAAAARTAEREGPLMCGPQLAAGGRGEERGRVDRPGGKRSGPSPKKQENFLFIQIKFK